MITEMLKTGAKNAQTAREICAILNLSYADFRRRIAEERKTGSPICASAKNPAGYYLASNQEEMRQYCGKLRHRAGEIFKTRKMCLDMIDALPAE